MANSYFTLTDSNGVSKKFVVITSGYQPSLEKLQGIQTTVDGHLDVSMGGTYEVHSYMIKVRETEPEDGYGTLADLKVYYRLNNPFGSPTNVLVLTDHFGVSHNVYMVDSFQEGYLGVMIIGPDAWVVIRCTFRFIP